MFGTLLPSDFESAGLLTQAYIDPLKQNIIPAVEDMNNRNLPLEKYAGKTLYACVFGENLDGYAYMVTFPVEVKSESVGI